MSSSQQKPKPKFSSGTRLAVIQLLRTQVNNRKPGEQPNQISAIQIANRCGLFLDSSQKYRRRKMRALIKEIREVDGVPILSELYGYYIAANAGDYANAATHAKTNGLNHLAKAANIKTHPQLPTQVDSWACSLKLNHLSDSDTDRKKAR